MNTYFGRTLEESYVEVVRRLKALPQYHKSRLKTQDRGQLVQHSLLRLQEWYQDVTSEQELPSLDHIAEDVIRNEVFTEIISMLQATQELFDTFEPHSTSKKDKVDTELSIGALKRSVEKLHALSEDLRDVPLTAEARRDTGRQLVDAAGNSSVLTKAVQVSREKSHSPKRRTGQIRPDAAPEDAAPGSSDRLRSFHTAHQHFEAARESLTNKFPRENHDDLQRIFVPRFVVREVFCRYPDDVKSLYVLASSHEDGDRSNREEHAEDFYHAVIGSSTGGDDDSSIIPEERGLSVILAMLLWMNFTPAMESWKRFERLCFSQGPNQLSLNDACLPMKRQELKEHFGEETSVNMLWEVQYTFRPVILESGTFKSAHEHYRPPYLEAGEKLGSGSAGTVYRCKIPRGHFESRNNVSKRALSIARKDIVHTNAQGMQAAKLEQLIHEKFMLASVTRHAHIMHPIAGLKLDSKISFFFDLARCNLTDYMKRGANGAGDGSAPDNDEQKLQILQQFIHLASALDFLHNGIQAPGYDRVICYHLDLKPENILVVPNEDPKLGDVFKISDFGISRIHYLRGSQKAKINPEGEVDIGISPYDTQGADSMRDVRTFSDLRESSTYISPEGMAEESRVSTSSDVWAFGCILCTLLSWLHGGWVRVEDFSGQRKKQGGKNRDYFFTSKLVHEDTDLAGVYSNMVIEEGQRVDRFYKLNPAVSTLFDDHDGLIRSCIGQPGKQAMYHDIWVLLRKQILRIDPGQRRIRMNAVREKLAKISSGIDQFEMSACRAQ